MANKMAVVETGYDPLNDMMAFEEGTLPDEDIIKLFQHLVNTGMAWTLQGFYGRTAVALIKAGLVFAE